jgi:hypothetical protein
VSHVECYRIAGRSEPDRYASMTVEFRTNAILLTAQWINCEPAGFLLAIVIRDGLIEGKVGESNDDLAN